MKMTKEDKTKLLGSAPVGRLFLKLALPAVLGQFVTLANNVIDRAWVGHIPHDGVLSLGAVGVCFPIQHLLSSVVLLLVAGMGPTLSILLGKGNRDAAGKTSGACFGAAAAVCLAVTATIYAACEWLLTTFGAAGDALPFARSYLTTIAWGLPFVNMLLMMQVWYAAQGYVLEGVLLSVASVAVNAVLDPVLIFGFGMGVTGAALATNAGAMAALAWGVWKAARDARLVRFGVRDLAPRPKLWLPSAALGLSTWISVSLESLAIMLINASLQRYGGDVAVATMSVFAVLNFVLVSLTVGLSMGAQPIVSYNFGQGRIDRVRQANRCFIGTAFACAFVLWAAVMACPRLVWTCFTSDAKLLDFAVANSRVFFAVLLLTGSQYAQVYVVRFLGQVKMSLLLGVLKRFVCLLPFIFILPAVLPCDKTLAVLASVPASEVAAIIVTAICYFHVMRKLKGETECRTVAASATGAVTAGPPANACRGGRDSTGFADGSDVK